MILAQAIVSGFLTGCVYAITSVGLTLIYSLMRLVNFAHGELLMLSMYLTYFAWEIFGLDPLFFLPICAIIMFLFGEFVYKQVISRIIDAPKLNQIFTTFAMVIFFQSLAQFLWGPDYKKVVHPLIDGRIDIAGLFLSLPQFVSGIVALVAFFSFYWFFMKTRTGKAMRATAQDAEAASAMGIDTNKMYMIAVGFGTAAVGIAGALLTNSYSVHPRAGIPFILIAFVVVALGGFGSVLGSLIGAIIVGITEAIFGLYLPPTFKRAIIFSLFILVMYFRPRGLMGKY